MTLTCRDTKGGRWRAALLLVVHLLVPGMAVPHAAAADLPGSGALLQATGETPDSRGHAEHTCPLCRAANEPPHLSGTIVLWTEGRAVYAELGTPGSAAPASSRPLSPDRAPRPPPAHS